MFSTLISGLNSLIYTLLAFIFPLYWSIKGLLRQYTVSIVPIESGSVSLPSQNHSLTSGHGDDSEVPSTFIEPSECENETTVKTTERVICETETNSNTYATTTSSSSAWLHYWVLLAAIHCITGLYERVFLPLIGNSFFYYCSKYISIYWLAKNDAQAARTLWTALLAPFVAKHEQAVDVFLQISIQQTRATLAESLVALRKLKLFKLN